MIFNVSRFEEIQTYKKLLSYISKLQIPTYTVLRFSNSLKSSVLFCNLGYFTVTYVNTVNIYNHVYYMRRVQVVEKDV